MSNQEAPILPVLVEQLGPVPEGVDIATALIAAVKPHTLAGAADMTLLTDFTMKMHASDDLPKLFDDHHTEIVSLTSDPAVKDRTRIWLEESLATQAKAESIRAGMTDEVQLARDVHAKRHELSRPVRWLAGLIGVAVIGGGGTALLYEAKQFDVANAVRLTEDYNRTAPEGYKLSVPDGEMQAEDYALVGGLGAIFVAAGAATGTLIGLGFTGPASRARAKRQMKRARM